MTLYSICFVTISGKFIGKSSDRTLNFRRDMTLIILLLDLCFIFDARRRHWHVYELRFLHLSQLTTSLQTCVHQPVSIRLQLLKQLQPEKPHLRIATVGLNVLDDYHCRVQLSTISCCQTLDPFDRNSIYPTGAHDHGLLCMDFLLA